MLIEGWKKERKVNEIINRRKKEIYEEVGIKKEQYKDIKLLEKMLMSNIKVQSDDTRTAEEFVNEIKDVFDKYNLTDHTTALTTALIYLFEIITY